MLDGLPAGAVRLGACAWNHSPYSPGGFCPDGDTKGTDLGVVDNNSSRDSAPTSGVKKVVLAYSGGLDTSIILKWLQITYGCEVITFTADLGQGEELAPARDKAMLLGIERERSEERRV